MNNIESNYVKGAEEYGKVKGDYQAKHDAAMGGLYASSLYASNVSCQLAITPSPESVVMTRVMYDELLKRVALTEDKLAQFLVLPRVSHDLTVSLAILKAELGRQIPVKADILSQLGRTMGLVTSIEDMVVNAGMGEK
jgi:hypothetical protein